MNEYVRDLCFHVMAMQQQYEHIHQGSGLAEQVNQELLQSICTQLHSN